VKELSKLIPLVQSWHLPKFGYVLALILLYEKIVDFNESLILILLAVVIDRSISGKRASPDGHGFKTKPAAPAKRIPPSA